MEITISITSQDILCNPEVIASVKALGQLLIGAEKTVDTKEQTEKADPQPPIFNIEEVRKKLGDLAKAKGSEAAKNILKAFNVCKVTELLEKDYPRVMDAVKAVK